MFCFELCLHWIMNGKMKTKDTCIAMDIDVKEQPMKPEAMEADLLIVLDGTE